MRFFLALALFIGVAAAQVTRPLSVLDVYGYQPTYGVTYPYTGFTHRTLGLHDIYERPLMVVAPTLGNTDVLTAYYLQNGLRSFRHLGGSYHALDEFFRSPYELSGLMFYPRGLYNDRLFNFGLHRVVFPENFRAVNFFRGMTNFDEIPVLMVLPKTHFDSLHLTGYTPLARFGIFRDYIEPYYGSYIPQYPYVPQYPFIPRIPYIPQWPLIPQVPLIPQIPIVPQVPVKPVVPVIAGSDSVAHSEAVSGSHSTAGSVSGSTAGSIAGSGAGSIAGSGAESFANSGATSFADSGASSLAGSGAGSLAGSGASSIAGSSAGSIAGSGAGGFAGSGAASHASSMAGSSAGGFA